MREEAMHELSIALSLVHLAQDAALQAGAVRVKRVQIEVGAMSGVVPEALELGFTIATRETILESAELRVTLVPVVVFCSPCGQEVEPTSSLSICCPLCGTPSDDIRRGQELDLVSLEIVEDPLNPEQPL
jgi:hydrogenase nickel incorporation protein HypA/HybF